MKGRMEAENLAACCLGKKKINKKISSCHGSGPRGTGVHTRCWGVNLQLIGSRGSCKSSWWDSETDGSLVSIALIGSLRNYTFQPTSQKLDVIDFFLIQLF